MAGGLAESMRHGPPAARMVRTDGRD